MESGPQGERAYADVYAELRSVARSLLRDDRPVTLQPTELVHETWARLDRHSFEGQTHYRRVAALAMRQILADHARARNALKRTPQVDLFSGGGQAPRQVDLVALHTALTELERRDERAYHVVCMRYLGGMTTEEVAESLGVSARTVQSTWRLTRAWLMEQLRG